MKANYVLAALLILGLFLPSLTTVYADDGRGLKKRERLESVIIAKFVTELELTPEQSERFFPIFRNFRDRSYNLYRDNKSIREELDSLSTAPAPVERSEKAAAPYGVNSLLDRQERNQQESIRMKRQFLDDVSPFLSPQQLSRCSVLLDELPARIREIIREEKMRRGDGDLPRRGSR